MNDNILLKMENVTKTFPGVVALDEVDFTVKKGEIHALLGENGAGKSTLMKCLIGMYSVTDGKIWFDGDYIENYTMRDSIEMQISMIHQELNPVLHKTVMENIWLGREPKNKFGLIDHKKMYDMTLDLFKRINIDIDPKAMLLNLTVAKIQMIEIVKAISYNAKLIIMDEPTSSLTDKEVEQLFIITKELKSQGISIIYISHKLEEIFELCDSVTIFRDGQYVDTRPISEIDTETMISMMVGRKVNNLFPKDDFETEIGKVRLNVKEISDGVNFKNISFDLKEGEILGFAGLIGAGRTEVMESLFGVNPITEGEIIIDNQKTAIRHTDDAIDNGIAFLTEDRRKTGIFPMLSVGYNLVSASIDSYKSKFGLLNTKAIKEDAEAYIDTFGIKTPSQETNIENLSGGNQQKVLIAKWLLTKPDILILDEPTRGIDVGAKTEIYRTMAKMAYTGKSIIMVSSELPEVLGMSDRIVVMHEGRITGILENKGLDQQIIMEYATGERDDFSDKENEVLEEELV